MLLVLGRGLLTLRNGWDCFLHVLVNYGFKCGTAQLHGTLCIKMGGGIEMGTFNIVVV